MTAFLEGNDFENVIRTAVSLGGDCDTLTCIAGGIAEAFYGIPLVMEAEVKSMLTEDMLRILEVFDELRGRGVEKVDELKWNSMIEEAISAFHQETNNEKFSAVIEAIYRRMYEGGSIMVLVIAPQNAFAMLDLEHMKVGDVVTAEEVLHFKFQHLNTDDGKLWAVAFTSEEEYKKGASSDIITMEIRQVLESFFGDCPEEGIIINPLGDKLLLTKEWINEILQLEKPKNELKFFVGDITQLPVDAIVNAANKSLLGGGGVDGAIHRAAGRELLEECRTLHGCRTGEAKITKGYRLPAKHVIHTVGPIYSGKNTDEEDLYRCYYNSLELAAKKHLYSIAFPGISTGVYGYPKEEAAQVALTAIMNWFDANGDYGMQVVVVNFSNADYEVYKKVIDNAKEGR
jgi:O-acetyl-ADP-ribose deacetylase (regulator of RNase III)